MTISKDFIEKFLKDLPISKGMMGEDVSVFVQNSFVKEYSKGEVVFLHGDEAHRFFYCL